MGVSGSIQALGLRCERYIKGVLRSEHYNLESYISEKKYWHNNVLKPILPLVFSWDMNKNCILKWQCKVLLCSQIFCSFSVSSQGKFFTSLSSFHVSWSLNHHNNGMITFRKVFSYFLKQIYKSYFYPTISHASVSFMQYMGKANRQSF